MCRVKLNDRDVRGSGVIDHAQGCRHYVEAWSWEFQRQSQPNCKSHVLRPLQPNDGWGWPIPKIVHCSSHSSIHRNISKPGNLLGRISTRCLFNSKLDFGPWHQRVNLCSILPLCMQSIFTLFFRSRPMMSNEKSNPSIKKEPGILKEEEVNAGAQHIPLPEYLTKAPGPLPKLSSLECGFTHNTRNGPGRSGNSDPDRHCHYPSKGGRGAMKCDACYDYNKGVAQGCCSVCGNKNEVFRSGLLTPFYWCHWNVIGPWKITAKVCKFCIFFELACAIHVPYK